MMVVVVVVVVCTEISKVSSFNNANVMWEIIQFLMDLTTIITCALLPQYNMSDNTTFTRAYCNRVSSHLWSPPPPPPPP